MSVVRGTVIATQSAEVDFDFYKGATGMREAEFGLRLSYQGRLPRPSPVGTEGTVDGELYRITNCAESDTTTGMINLVAEPVEAPTRGQ